MLRRDIDGRDSCSVEILGMGEEEGGTEWGSLFLQGNLKRCLTESTGDIIFGKLVTRICENPVGGTHLHQISKVEIGSTLGYPGCLLHCMRYDNDGKLLT